MESRYSQPKHCTTTMLESDFRLLVACVYEAQHHALAFSERRTDERLSMIVQQLHSAIAAGRRDLPARPAQIRPT